MGEYTHLSSLDRRRFYTFLEMKLSIANIAKKLDKHRSTLYRELKRNKEPEGYLPGVAQLKTDERAQQKRPTKIEKDTTTRTTRVKGQHQTTQLFVLLFSRNDFLFDHYH
jgi:IS30 family transposase